MDVRLSDLMRYTGDFNGTPQYGDGGFIDTAENGFLSGLGGSLSSLGSFGQAEFGVGQGLQDFGDNLMQGRQARRDYSWNDMQESPLQYVTDPNGLMYSISNLAGSSLPAIAATAAATAAIGATGGAAVAPLASAIAGGSSLARAISVGGRVLGSVAGAAVGGTLDSAVEGGQSYQQALQQGQSQDQAKQAAESTFGANVGISTVSELVGLKMLKNAGGVAGRMFGNAAEDVAESGGSKLLGAMADFGDKNFATRFATRSLPGMATEAYTEGLQNEVQNWAVNGDQIQYNPLDMSDDSKTQMAQAFFGMLPTGAVGAVGRYRTQGNNNEVEQNVQPTEQMGQSVQNGPVEGEVSPEQVNIDQNDQTVDVDSTPVQQLQDEIPVTQGMGDEQLPNNNFNDSVQKYMAEPSEYDTTENQLYSAGNVPDYAYHQALANTVLDSAESRLGYNPVSGNERMSNASRDKLATDLKNTDEYTGINDDQTAKTVSNIIQQRNNNAYLQNQAKDIIQQKQDIGLNVSEQELANAQSVAPSKTAISQFQTELRDAVKNNTATPEQKLENAKQVISNSIKNESENSNFYTSDGIISDKAKQRLRSMGVSPNNKEILNTMQTQSDIVNANRDASISNEEQKQDVMQQAETPDSVLQAHLQTANELNKNGVGISIDPEKLSSMTPSKRNRTINSAQNQILKRQELVSSDARQGIMPVRQMADVNDDTAKKFLNGITGRARNPEKATEAIHALTDKFFNYNKLNWPSVLNKFNKEDRPAAQSLVKNYLNYRATGKLNVSKEDVSQSLNSIIPQNDQNVNSNTVNSKTNLAQSIDGQTKSVSASPDSLKTVENPSGESTSEVSQDSTVDNVSGKTQAKKTPSETQSRISEQGIPTVQQTAARSMLYGLFDTIRSSNKGKKQLSVINANFSDPRSIFKEYMPNAMPVYDLADKARRKMEDTIEKYNASFTGVFGGMNKDNVAGLENAIRYADKLHRDPVQVISLDNGLHLVLSNDGYIEHFDDNQSAIENLNDLRKSGAYRVANSVEEKPDNSMYGSGVGTTVYGLSDKDKVFRTKESAQKYADSIYKSEMREVINNISDKQYSNADADIISDRFMKYRQMSDMIWNDMASVGSQYGNKIPKKIFGYYPHMHLPYVVYEQDSAGVWNKTTSFYTPREASKYVDKVNKAGGKAQYSELSPIDSMLLRERLGAAEKLTPEQLQAMKEAGILKDGFDEYQDFENHNKALKSMFSPLFQKYDEVPVEKVLRMVHSIQSRTPKKNNDIYNNTLRVAQQQIKTSGIYKELQKVKAQKTITRAGLDEIINRANMKYKFNPNFMKQTDAEGYNKDVRDSFYKYAVHSANYVSKAKFLAESTAIYHDVFHADFDAPAITQEQKFLKTYIQANSNSNSVTAFDEFMNKAILSIPGLGQVLRRYYSSQPYTDAARTALSVQNVLKLGMFNPSSAVVQLAQLLNANARLGGNKVIGMSKFFRQGVREATFGHVQANTKYKELFDYIGMDNKNFALDNEVMGKTPGVFNKKLVAGNSIKDFADKSMLFFRVGDVTARKATAIGGYLKAQELYAKLPSATKQKMLESTTKKWQRAKDSAAERKVSFTESKPTMESVKKDYLFKYSKDLVTDTNFDYSIVNTPLALTRLGVTGKLLLQFKKYQLFSLNFMKNNTAAENVRFIVPMILMAGVLGLPAANFFDDTAETLTGHSPVLALKKQIIMWAGSDPTKKAIANVAMYGAPSLANINLSGRIGLQDAASFDLGPTASTIQNIVKGKGVVQSLSPRAGTLDSIVSGQYENSKGDKITDLSPYDRMLKVFGFKPIAETNAADSSRVLQQYREKFNQVVSQAKKDYVKSPTNDNYQALKIYGVSDKDIANMLRTKDTSTVDKQIKVIPKKNQSDDAKELRSLATSASAFAK